MNLGNTSNRARIFLAALVLILGAFWAGARFGPHGPSKVEAVPLRSSGLSQVAARDSGLTEEESINVRIYRQASPAVANILTKATEYDFFMDPVPVDGAGSVFIIDPRGYILTNYHVVEGAQSIEVVLGDQSHHPAKYIGADQRNDDVFRGMMRLISQNHFNGLRAFHNVIVGQDVAPRIDDETGPAAFHGNRDHNEIVLRRFRQDIRHRR